MAYSPFRIVEHVVPGQHIREYPAATANNQEEPLNLVVKQYIPLDNPDPQPGDVTILAAHANGFPKVWQSEIVPCLFGWRPIARDEDKYDLLISRTNSHQELYEPLWEEIYARSKGSGFRIRSIWMADVAWQGESSVLNEDVLGNDRMYPLICDLFGP